jgi:putative addiction module component (TIGR02574 family)
MSVTLESVGADRLPPADRLDLIAALWDSLSEAALPVPDWHTRLLDRRLAAADADPASARPWAEVKARLLGES